jgi:predicted RNase H-like HicB family nuclease
MSNTKIEWTESTWNPVTGCTKISSGCKNCYAERMAMRLQAIMSLTRDHYPVSPIIVRLNKIGYDKEKEVTLMNIEIEQEDDGRWIAEVPDLPGAMAYGHSKEDAVSKVKALAFRVMADRLEHGEEIPELRGVFPPV